MQYLISVYKAWSRMSISLGRREAFLYLVLGAIRKRLHGLLDWNWRVHIFVANEHCPWGAYLRPGSSDWNVFRQIFVEREYEPFCARIPEAGFIVDIGANIGLSALYFLERYTGAYCICIEPDEDNFNTCRKNLKRYGERAKVIRKALWSSATFLILQNHETIGKEWGIRVNTGDMNGPTVEGVTMEQVLAQHAEGMRVSILKFDAEGAEAEVFGNERIRWMDQVENMCIELHGQKCREAVMRCLAQYDHLSGKSGELSLFWGITKNNSWERP
jgi:FkbM family methyltransferase